MVESPAAWTAGTAIPASADTAATCATRLPSSRREMLLLSFEFTESSSQEPILSGKGTMTPKRPKVTGHPRAGTPVYRWVAAVFHGNASRRTERLLDQPLLRERH